MLWYVPSVNMIKDHTVCEHNVTHNGRTVLWHMPSINKAKGPMGCENNAMAHAQCELASACQV